MVGKTWYCPKHGRWIIWKDCTCPQHYRSCPECPAPRRFWNSIDCRLKVNA